MNFLETLQSDTLSEFEMLKFLKVEVKKLADINEKLEKEREMACIMAYSCGFEDRDTGRDFDPNFKIDYLKDDD